MRTKLVLVGVILALFAYAPGAAADSITYSLNWAHNWDPGFAGPYGTVTLTTQDAHTVGVDVGLAYPLGFINAFDLTAGFNLVGHPSVTITPTTEHFSSVDQGGNLDGFGDFMYGVACGGSSPSVPCGKGASNPIYDTVLHFTVYSANGLGLASFLQPSTGTDHTIFAVDVYSSAARGGTGLTGAIGTTGDPVPEPASMLLLGTGLLGAGVLARRRK